MSNIQNFFEDDDERFPLSFMEVVGDHAITDSIRRAIIWASIKKFAMDEESMSLIDTEDFTQDVQRLANSINFHGPFGDLELAVEESKERVGVLVAPKRLWSEDHQFVYIAVLAN